jgi:hypothetical protein
MPMEVQEKQMFMFKSNINGSAFEFGRVALNKTEAAMGLATDLEKFASELREIAKSGTKSS